MYKTKILLLLSVVLTVTACGSKSNHDDTATDTLSNMEYIKHMIAEKTSDDTEPVDVEMVQVEASDDTEAIEVM